METLYAQCLLWALGLATGEAYADTLHRAYRAQPESALLTGLEACTTDPGHSLSLLEAAAAAQGNAFSQAAFAKALFSGLQTVYTENHFELTHLGKKCYALWKALPTSLRNEEPFLTLSYAQDSLSWGDEATMWAHLERAIAQARGR